jgi:hypothetical protein
MIYLTNQTEEQYAETARRDFERRIYQECDAEDRAEDDVLEDLRDGTLVRSIDNSDLPMFDSEG